MTTESSSSQESAELQELRSHFQIIGRLNVESDLVRATQLGGMSFGAWRDEFSRIIERINQLATLPWERLTTRQIGTVRDHARNLQNALQQVNDFELNVGDLEGQRNARAANVSSQFEQLLQEVIPLVGYLSWEAVDINALRAEMQTALRAAQTEAQSAIEEIQRLGSEADDALTAIREVSAEAGVAHHAETFATAAKRHEERAARWLRTSVVAGVATIAAGLVLVWLWETNGDISDASVLQVVLAKAVVLSVGFYFTVTSVRLYRSSTHLAVVNRHREDSLRTFRAFAEGAGDDPETKAKVLLEATHAAFGQVPTGLVAEGSSSGVVEVLDGVTGLVRRSQ